MRPKALAKSLLSVQKNGVRYELEKQNPDKKFYFAETEPVCPGYEADHTGKKFFMCLQTGENEVHITEDLRKRIRKRHWSGC